MVRYPARWVTSILVRQATFWNPFTCSGARERYSIWAMNHPNGNGLRLGARRWTRPAIT